ncbi:MAG: tRNA lysidine(34) synthetase TilS [Acidobacteria bacterium]|nr:MAG: tRNA lysidine(34) synthetase TilS [Acidobacteriota bacterium]
MDKFVRNLITEWRKLELPFDGETVVVAVSGGADSMSLMLALHELRSRKKILNRTIVAHLNHRLRGAESDEDEAFVREQTAQLGFEFVSKSTRLPKTGNLEQHARDARYKFLRDVAIKNKAFAVLTAHTQNDQAETFLLNLIRGSGPDGLSGMKSIRDMDGVSLIRPLLSWATRSDTEEFCASRRVEFRTDRMNHDEKFSRVRIRRKVLPLLAEMNPGIIKTLARSADLIRRGVEADKSESANAASESLALKDLKSMDSTKLYATLRSWLRTRRGTLRGLGLENIQAIERLIRSRKSGKTVELPAGGRVVKHDGTLRYMDIKVEK